jgi:ATP-dependent Clp protease ATP-binding subunit ClpB
MAFTDIDAGDYRLKNVSLPNVCNGLPDQKLRQLGWPTQFSVKTLCAAIQQKCTVENISWYLQSYVDDSFLQDTMPTEGWPALYYAIERNSPEVMSLLLQHGTNPNTSYKAFKLPVLAFAIFQGHREANDSTEIVRVLLAAGANPQIIPIDMWEQYLETPRRSLAGGSKSRRIASLPSSVYAAWCTSEIRPLIADALYLSQRYLLSVANKLSKPNKRWVQIAKGNKMTDLAKLPYFLIGQRPATNMVMKTVTSHVAIGRQRPLVMAFAGLSGHGKTELARALGGLISVKTTVINCASVTDVWGLFGPTMGWSGYEKGSQLNNFLAQNSSQRSVVFLDEFDKTKKEVRDALLLATEKGMQPIIQGLHLEMD